MTLKHAKNIKVALFFACSVFNFAVFSSQQKTPSTVSEFGTALATYKNSLDQAQNLINSFNPSLGTIDALKAQINAANSALNQAKANLSIIFAGYTAIRSKSSVRQNVSRQTGIDDNFNPAQTKILNDLSAALAQKTQTFLDREKKAQQDKDAAVQAARDAKQKQDEQIARLLRGGGAAQDIANRQQEELKGLRQAFNQALQENDRIRKLNEDFQKQLETLAAQQRNVQLVLPDLKLRADQASQLDAQIAAMQKQHKNEVDQVRQAASDEIKRLSDILQNSATALQNSQNALTKLTADLQTSQQNAASAAAQNQQMATQIADLQKQLKQIDDLGKQNEQLKQALSLAQTKKAQTDQLTAELEKLRAQVKDMDALKAQNNALAVVAGENKTLKDAIVQNQNDLKQAKSELKTAADQLMRVQAELASHKKSDEQNAADLKQKIASNEEKDAVIENLKVQLADAAKQKKELEDSKVRVSELEAEAAKAAELTEINKNLQNQLAAAQQDKKALNDAQAKIADLEKTIISDGQLKTDLANARAKTDAMQKTIAQLQEEIKGTKASHQDELNRLKEENKSLHDDIASLKADAEQQLTLANNKNAKLQQQMEQISAAHLNDANNLRKAQDTIDQLQAEKKRTDDLQKQLAQLQSALAQAQNELKTKGSESKADVDNLKNQLAILQQQAASATKENKTLNERIAKYQAIAAQIAKINNASQNLLGVAKQLPQQR